MALLNDKVRDQVRDLLKGLEKPVKMVMFTQGGEGPVGIECSMCAETRQLAEEVADLSDKISVKVYDLVKDAELAGKYNIDKIPAIAMLGGDEEIDYGIRLYGIPSGYEFSTFIEDIRLVSSGKHELNEKTLRDLEKLDKPVHIQVYVTPTWPYCPRAVVLAHKLAVASEWVTADMVEASEFPHLANKYQVYGVPRTVINEVIHIEGAVPENMLMTDLMTVMDDKEMDRLRKEME